MFIYSNLAVSLDGKIATRERSFLPLGTHEDQEQMIFLRQQCDAILMGASTLRSFKRPCLSNKESSPPVNIILSSTLEGISPSWEFFQAPNIKRILFVSSRISKTRIKTFQKTSEVVTLKKDSPKNPVAIQIVEHLTRNGIGKLLVEGGGSVMWDFVSQNLIDEFHVTLTPRILGGTESPTLVDGVGFRAKEIVNLSLQQCRVVGDELYLIYRKKEQRGISARE